MCGIAGIISADPSRITKGKLGKMTDAIAHRGPDGEQQWISRHGNAGLGHRRLAILDLSSAAIQPMHFQDRYTIVYNGEVYNYIELRSNLEQKGYHFVSKSDTEVILAAYAHYGRDCCQHLDGMFAFAIWDEKKQELFAARDRFGEKPFYYTLHQNALFFASEIKALSAVTETGVLKPSTIINFITLGHSRIPPNGGETIYSEVKELPPASRLNFKINNNTIDVSRYWRLMIDINHSISEPELFNNFRELWQQSLKTRLRSDVSVGCSLSGGLDSSSIVAGIYDKTNGDLNTYSAVFPGFDKDESSFITAIGNRFACKQQFTTPDAAGLATDIRKMIWHQETYVSSASAYAQYAVFKLAREHGTTVMLDGQGADEILGGYRKHIQWALQELYRRPPGEFRHALTALDENGILYDWTYKNKIAAAFPVLAATMLRQREWKKIRDAELFTGSFLNTYNAPRDLPTKPVIRSLNDILYYDTTDTGLSELLHFADRNSMAHGREVRLPYLSHQLVSFLFTLPLEFKFRNGWTKWLLRKSMETQLPCEIAWRKDKIGFEPPQISWMNNPVIQDMIMSSKESLVKAGILNKRLLTKKIQPHESHAADNFDWRILVTDLLLTHSHQL